MPTLALFDLDHTLIPFDSGMAWTDFLVGEGVLPPEFRTTYLAYCHQYVAGTLDIRAMHRASVAPLQAMAPAELDRWLLRFEAAVADRLPEAARALVQHHRAAGDRCAIVTATTRFVAEPFARLFGIDDLIATEAERIAGQLTGEIAGEPCYREHKLTHVNRWLALQAPALPTRLSGFSRSWFYSDSAGDLPLLQAVSNPVAVSPDQRLCATAAAAGWPVIRLG